MYITTHNLSYRYKDSSIPALNNLTASFSQGWNGIVGDNGAGKSTFLRLVCGKLSPSEGTISPIFQGLYCAQSTEFPPDNLEDFALDYSSAALKIRKALEIDDEWLWHYFNLSHGEQKRIQIACSLYLHPPVLALDEPSNHLDVETRNVVRLALLDYKGIGFLVSHDRSFLDDLVTQCVFLKSGKATVVPGNYSAAKKQLELQYKTMVSERKNAKVDLTRLQIESHRRQDTARRATSRRSARGIDKHDHDAKEKIKLAIVSGQDGKTGLLSAQMNKRLEGAQARLEKARVEKCYDGRLELVSKAAQRKILLSHTAGILPLSETKSLSFPDVCIGNLDRIGLRGKNGSGKSSFLNYLLQTAELGEKLLYIPQEMSEKEGQVLLDEVKKLPSNELGQVFSIVARLNSPPERILSGENLSPGELRKLILARGILKQPYLIVMDEPTNHLDIHSIEALQNVLKSCNCALILVSHDKHFLEALTDIHWIFNPKEDNTMELKVVLV